ncbi:hypothetical protein C8Q77DRAFT_81212 [Trametes polyzona]|nr:hypothetical protein C8Q77DRAFT_81212 [Trametes polyzona]
MSDDTRSLNHRKARGTRRILVLSNPSPESSGDEAFPPPPETYKPRPLPSPSRSLPSTEQYYNGTYHNVSVNPPVPPLTTDLHCYPRSNPSNGTLSSPDSSSSPAVESTPPPSTPGFAGPGIHLTDEGTIRQDTIKPTSSDRSDNTPPSSRPRPYERMRSHLPGQFPTRRGSLSGPRPATSPTVSTPDSYAPPVAHMFRSSPMEKVVVLVTTDAENLQVVDITGAMTPAFIRERIFTKLQISDEDQAKYSIYRTEVGQFAIGEALTDEELFDLYKERGDHSGNLKLLVSHSSASVHEPAYDQIASATVNTIPPPVLPQQALHGPLRPNRAARLRQDSLSSASEAHQPEVEYEASVSDYLDHGDADGVRDARETARPAVHARTLPTPGFRPSSPIGRHRSRSPAGMLSPERTILRSPEAYPHRPDPFYPSVGVSALPGTSPKSSRFVEGSHVTPTEPYPNALAEPHVERERSHTNDGKPSSYSDRQGRVQRDRDDRAFSDRERRRREPAREREARNASPRNLRHGEYDRRDGWTWVPQDLPSANYEHDKPRRFPLSPPSISGMTNALSLRPLPGSSTGSGDSGRKKSDKRVPSTWAVNWKPPPHGLVRGAAKSMNNLKDAYNKIPPALQPGRPTRAAQPPLPTHTRPSTGGSTAGGGSSYPKMSFVPFLRPGTCDQWPRLTQAVPPARTGTWACLPPLKILSPALFPHKVIAAPRPTRNNDTFTRLKTRRPTTPPTVGILPVPRIVTAPPAPQCTRTVIVMKPRATALRWLDRMSSPTWTYLRRLVSSTTPVASLTGHGRHLVALSWAQRSRAVPPTTSQNRPQFPRAPLALRLPSAGQLTRMVARPRSKSMIVPGTRVSLTRPLRRAPCGRSSTSMSRSRPLSYQRRR